ncbi:MAG: response regulator [Terriglobales bacterium]
MPRPAPSYPHRVRVVLADDHALVRQGFRRLLEDDARIEVVGEAGTGLEAIARCREQHPDVALLDLAMPELNGLAAAAEIVRAAAETKILILSMHADPAHVQQALRAGVQGYVLKDAADLDLAQAVLAVAAGGTYWSPGTAAIMADLLRQPAATADPWERLTLREREVLQLIASGKSNKETAALLGISPNTVAVHRANVMATLGLRGTAEIALYAVKRGLIPG